MQELYLGQTNVSLLERCLQFRGVLIEGGGGGDSSSSNTILHCVALPKSLWYIACSACTYMVCVHVFPCSGACCY